MTQRIRLIARIAALSLLALSAAAGAFAQGARPAPPPQGEGQPGGRAGAGRGSSNAPTAAEVQVLFDAMVLVQAQKALGLTDVQYPQFVGRLKMLQDTRRRFQWERTQLIGEIGKLSAPANAVVDEAQLRAKLKALDDLQAKGASEVQKAYEGVDQVLDVRQQARFRVFEEQIERRKFQFLLNARRAQGPTGTK